MKSTLQALLSFLFAAFAVGLYMLDKSWYFSAFWAVWFMAVAVYLEVLAITRRK